MLETNPSTPDSARRLTHIMYGLQAAAYVLGVLCFLSIVSVVIAYTRYDQVKNTWLESHFQWQIRTFWWGLLWGIIGSILMLAFGLGAIILLADYIWLVYRVVRGWLALADNKPVTAYTRTVN